MSHLAADNIKETVEKQHTQYVQSICNAYAALIGPHLKAKYKMSDRELNNILQVGERAIKRANARKEKSS